MNSFFFKNLMSSTANNKNTQDQERSDFQRLIQLCNSYGLNEEQTKQLINQFKKGSYKSSTTSLNQSMVSQQNDMSMSEQQPEHSEHNYQYSQNSLEPSRTFQQQKLHPQYEEEENYHESQSSNRYYGYENEMENKQEEQSYNQMTFNEQNSMMLNSHRFHDGAHGQFGANVDSRVSSMKQEMLLQHKINERLGERNFVQENRDNRQLERNNSKKQTLLQKRPSNQLNYPTLNQAATSQLTRIFKQSVSTKTLSQHQQKGSQFNYSKQQKTSQQTSKYSQTSIQSHEIDNQPVNGLNPEYVKALIRNFQLLQGQNEALKEENLAVQQKNKAMTKEYDLMKKENEKMRSELQDIKNKEKFSSNQTVKFQALYEAQKQKNQVFMNMKEKDSEVIKGLKDSLLQLTQMVKEKDTQNSQLQQRLFSLYDKLHHQGSSSSSSKYMGSSQMNANEFDQTGGSGQTYFGKSFSKKSLVSSESEKSLKPTQGQDQIKERPSNYGRKQLAEMMANNINLPPNNRQSIQQSKQLVRQPSASRLNSQISDQNTYNKKLSPYPPNIPSSQTRQSKQNVFTPLQVQPAIKRNVTPNNNSNKHSSQEDKKRPSSRVDIKKYKGMIEELRNSYSNVGNGERMVR